ncbi:AI-2E family transporter [Arcticibacterium luteifluviistationis]|uniref:AI-2E family transporter n=1 Tax=Arcticibacterium luteifluviistationis TaxID=1784714 RepID=A0A2Z4G6M9_9BACT|nr:AI-2E family transporter [Arcticibacterium luteifluviistationis]AWV96784.1 AI-2E family transporter [Arcticibacterium luteifluviistationis]
MIITTNSAIKKIVLIFLVVAGLYLAKTFLMPLLIGGILATVFLPFCNWLERRGLSRGFASFFAFLLFVLIVAILVSLIGWQISGLIKDVNIIKQKAIEIGLQTQQYIFSNLGISLEKQSKFLQGEQPSLASIMQLTIGSLSSIITFLVLIITYFLFLLYSRRHIKQFFIRLVSPPQQAEMAEILTSATKVSQQYLFGISKMIVCLWFLYGIGFSALGIKNAIFFAILCGLLEIIPYVGNLTGSTLTFLVAALHGASPSTLGGIVIIYGSIQLFQGWVLEPFILGRQVKINPLFTIIALVLGELVWGIPGILLAIPLLAIFKIVGDHIEQLKPYSFLVGELESIEPESSFMKKLKGKFRSFWVE